MWGKVDIDFVVALLKLKVNYVIDMLELLLLFETVIRTDDRSLIVTYLTHYVCSFSYTQLFVCLYLSQTCLYMFNDKVI
jgi:hypothetical protein